MQNASALLLLWRKTDRLQAQARQSGTAFTAGCRPTNFVGDIERASAQPAPLSWAHAAAHAAVERTLGTDTALARLQAMLQEEASSGGIGGALWRALRARDRDASGRLTAAEFGAALATARVRFTLCRSCQACQGCTTVHLLGQIQLSLAQIIVEKYAIASLQVAAAAVDTAGLHSVVARRWPCRRQRPGDWAAACAAPTGLWSIPEYSKARKAAEALGGVTIGQRWLAGPRQHPWQRLWAHSPSKAWRLMPGVRGFRGRLPAPTGKASAVPLTLALGLWAARRAPRRLPHQGLGAHQARARLQEMRGRTPR